VNILRCLDERCIRLELDTRPTPPVEDESPAQAANRVQHDKETLLREFSELLDASGQIVNVTKFHKDLVNRERKATTGIGAGVAVPHVRSTQVRSFVMGFARSREGLPFASIDGQPVRLFFLLASPSFEDRSQEWDRIYLRVYRQIAEMVTEPWVVEAFLDAREPQDIFNVLRGFVVQ
jgi:mannitol/fructose-specific phosphotransferase system IIA component (Ntr-type)